MDRLLRTVAAFSAVGLVACLTLLAVVQAKRTAPPAPDGFRCYEGWPRNAESWCRVTRVG